MKLSIIKYAGAALMVLALAGCEKKLLESNRVYVFPGNNEVGLKFVHAFAGKAPALTAGAGPGLFMYLGSQKLNGNVLTWTSNGGFWPATSSATTNTRSLYSIVPAGQATLYGVLGRVAAGIPAPAAGDTIFTRNQNWEAGKFYTVFFTDTMPTPGTLVVEDDMSPIPEGRFRLRFGNLMAWPGDVQQVFSTRENRVIFDNVGYKQVSNFIDLPVPSRADTLVITKKSGPSPMPYTININGFTGQSRRGYTIITKGKNLSTTTSATFQNFMGSIITVY